VVVLFALGHMLKHFVTWNWEHQVYQPTNGGLSGGGLGVADESKHSGFAYPALSYKKSFMLLFSRQALDVSFNHWPFFK